MKKNKEKYWNYDYNYDTMLVELSRLCSKFEGFDADQAIEIFHEFMDEEFNNRKPDPRLLNDYFKQIEYWKKFKKDQISKY